MSVAAEPFAFMGREPEDAALRFLHDATVNLLSLK